MGRVVDAVTDVLAELIIDAIRDEAAELAIDAIRDQATERGVPVCSCSRCLNIATHVAVWLGERQPYCELHANGLRSIGRALGMTVPVEHVFTPPPARKVPSKRFAAIGRDIFGEVPP